MAHGGFQQQAMLYFISGFLLALAVECKPVEVFPLGQAVVPDIELAAVPDVQSVGRLAVWRLVGQ